MSLAKPATNWSYVTGKRQPAPDINEGLDEDLTPCSTLVTRFTSRSAAGPTRRNCAAGKLGGGEAVGATAIFAVTGTTGVRPFGYQVKGRHR